MSAGVVRSVGVDDWFLKKWWELDTNAPLKVIGLLINAQLMSALISFHIYQDGPSS